MIPIPPPIAPRPEGPKPFWSVMIPTYNRVAYLQKALRSVLAQDPGPEQMQIEVVDNCSDAVDMEAFVRGIAGDRVAFHRNPKNIGAYYNFNLCISRSRGEWVHLFHDDDVVSPGFYEELGKGIYDRSDVGLAFCRHGFIDHDDKQTFVMPAESQTPGVLADYVERMAVCVRMQFPAVVVRRSAYEAVGGFYDADMEIAGDWEMWLRIGCKCPVWYEPKLLAFYRQHGSAGSTPHLKTAFQTRDIRKTIAIIKGYLPNDRAPFLLAKARDHYAMSGLSTAAQMMQNGQVAWAMNHIREALLISQSPAVMRAIDSGIWRQLQRFSQAIAQHVDQFRANPGVTVTSATIRAIRRHIAEQWLDLSIEHIEDLFANEFGKLHMMVLSTGIREQTLTEDDQSYFLAILAGKGDLLADVSDLGRVMAGLLYRRGAQLPLKTQGRFVPAWLQAALNA